MNHGNLFSERDSCGFGLIVQMDGAASHRLVQTAILSLQRMAHRGALAADDKSGDGCGLSMRPPEEFLRALADAQGWRLAPLFAVGMLFLNRDAPRAAAARAALERNLHDQGLERVGWRPLSLNGEEACGAQALASLPRIEQVFVNAPERMAATEFERRLYIARRLTEKAIEPLDAAFHVASLSARLLIYKGLTTPRRLPLLYPDLADARLASALCLYHQRFATNTLPQWRLAQPFRLLAHNGEINTIQGNRNWAAAREGKLVAPLLPDLGAARPLVSPGGSDSYSLDNMAEALLMGGVDPFRAIRLLIPPAWQNLESMAPDLRAFHEYNSMHMEPWDGPAGIVLSDGRYAVCAMDRNGLRPARWVMTRDRHVTIASEIGVFDYPPEEAVQKGRLGPGQMVAVDTVEGRLLTSEQIDDRLKKRHPYRRWLRRHRRRIETRPSGRAATPEEGRAIGRDALTAMQKLFQVSVEERREMLLPLVVSGREATGSMGDDTPLPALSRQTRSLYATFRQQFAQVTNPAIDSLRERIVMSLETCFGRERGLFTEEEAHARRIVVSSPLLSADKFAQLLELDAPDCAHERLELDYAPEIGLRAAIEALCDRAEAAVRAGKTILVLSDRTPALCAVGDRRVDAPEVSETLERLPIHALLATGAAHHRLCARGLRCDANIVTETGTARDPHQIAALIGCGATAVYPWLVYAIVADLARCGDAPGRSVAEAVGAYRAGVNKGLYKILSKMGISVISSYRGAQLFEAVGLSDEVIDLCFPGLPSRIGGARFVDLEADQRALLAAAQRRRLPLPPGGLFRALPDGEYHACNPEVVHALHAAVESGDRAAYRRYADLVNRRPAAALRDLLEPRPDIEPIPVDAVEPWQAIARRFDSAAMSLGALSPEAHEALAIAMNRLGGRSNSGEGGEDPRRFGSERVSKIKQIAAGRFGVTPHYLVNAEVLQIKIAQGAKPGEGGQLPGDKVNALIARLRFCTPGTTLISPPPHHDIYSIEDLAQLIFDLKQVNPTAEVSVKLVAATGIGAIATGVAKARADLITVSGYDGGTGASPLTSIKYAGLPWELGLTEVHRTLRANRLRDRVRLQVDGGLKTGLDVVKGAILGAESFGFGVAPMFALGCQYLRICHLNNCATGIATQDETLRREHFTGAPERVVLLFRRIAEETREWMARLGVASLDALVGRTDLLRVLPGATDRQRNLRLAPLLDWGDVPRDLPHHWLAPPAPPLDAGAALAERMFADAEAAIAAGVGGRLEYRVNNTHRAVGARLSGEIVRRHGAQGLPGAPLEIALRGVVGQSFGAWNAAGLHLTLEGDANDYVGKGMAGGKLTLRPAPGSTFASHKTPIMGNTCLYGATGGALFAAGLAGERFAVRNSGATAVVEGVGNHGCEYMTGGAVAVLGPTGINFGAAMTGGFAFVLDQKRQFVDRCNPALIDTLRITAEEMSAHRAYLHDLIVRFAAETRSAWGRKIARRFDDFAPLFWLVKPKALGLDALLGLQREAA